MSIDLQFNSINEKLQEVLKRYSRLQKENDRLKEELLQWKNNETAMQQKIDELQQQLSILKLASGELSPKDRKDFERKVSQYVKEIDRCISFLSQ
jgi:chromosome segregation ATPase